MHISIFCSLLPLISVFPLCLSRRRLFCPQICRPSFSSLRIIIPAVPSPPSPCTFSSLSVCWNARRALVSPHTLRQSQGNQQEVRGNLKSLALGGLINLPIAAAKHWKGYKGRGAEDRRRGLARAKDDEPGDPMTLLLSISNHFTHAERIFAACPPASSCFFMPACLSFHIWIRASKFKNTRLGLIIGLDRMRLRSDSRASY